MLTVHSVSKSYNLQTLFKNVNFSVNPGDRVGLIGPNGSGKTTLFRIIIGEELPDTGSVSPINGLRIGYLPQGFEPDPGQTLQEIIGQAAGDITALEGELTAVSVAISQDPDNNELISRYDEILRRIEFSETGWAASILSGLDLAHIPGDFPAARLSGGQKTRLSLALVLLGDPVLLLLDEPTNHLDIEMLEWLEQWLVQSGCGVLIISHDRAFLDNVVNRILYLDAQLMQLKEYPGNYSDFLEQRQMEASKQWSAYRDQQAEIKRMKQDIARTRQQAEHTERMASSIRIGGPEYKMKGFKNYQQTIAKKVARKAKARETKLDKYLDSDERVEKPGQSWEMKLDFDEAAPLGKSVIVLENLSVGYDPAFPLLEDIDLQVRSGRRIVLTGPNGSGKTTLLRTIAGEIPALEGKVRIGASVRLGYLTQDQADLDGGVTPVDLLSPDFPNQTETRRFLHKFLFSGDEPLKPIQLLSYGQRTRLMLARLVVDGCNVLLLDEPVNHLDILSRTQFEEALKQFEGAVIAVVHDRYFIDRFAQEIWWTEEGTIKKW